MSRSRPGWARNIRRGTVRRALNCALPHKSKLILFLTIVVVDSAITIVVPLLYREIINRGIIEGDTALIIRLALVLGVLGVFDSALGVAQTFLALRIGADIIFSLRDQLFQHVQRMPLAFFSHAKTGSLVSRLNADIQAARTAFTDILSSIIGNLITTCLILGAMLVLSWRVTLGVLLIVPIFALPARMWSRKLQAITRETYDLAGEMNTLLVERFNVAGALLCKLCGRPKEDAQTFRDKARRVSDISIRLGVSSRLFFAALAAVASATSAMAYGWGGMLAVHHLLDVGSVVALTAYLTQLYAPLVGLSNAQLSIMTVLVSFERVFEILDLEITIEDPPHGKPIPAGSVSIEFCNVTFCYPSSADVRLASLESVVGKERQQNIALHDVSFRIAPGQLTAIVGPSGAGKTTITSLISRLYDVQRGSVRISGLDVREIPLASLVERIGVVTQETHLFHESIRANLVYAKPDATEDQIRSALRDSQMLALIESLPEKLETIVGERGYHFSGGEKQRLAIARLLLKSPDIVILDEATSHLDSESEAAIQRALEVALMGRTSIVIAHRLSTIVRADEIVVVQGGRIVQRGTHATLLAQQGMYKELYHRQFAKGA